MYAEPQVITDTQDCTFYHTVDLPEFGVQEGQWDLRGKFVDYMGDVDCFARRVSGHWVRHTGFLSFSGRAGWCEGGCLL